MKFLCVAGLFFCVAGVAGAAEPVLKETPLPGIKATVGLPEGWFVKEESEDGVMVYHLTREKVEGGDGTFLAGLTLTVTPKVQERAEMPASKYAEELVEGMADENNPAVKTAEGPFKVFSVAYVIEGEAGNINIMNYAKANDATGTLYFVSWQAPMVESDKMDPLREKILSSFKFDPAY